MSKALRAGCGKFDMCVIFAFLSAFWFCKSLFERVALVRGEHDRVPGSWCNVMHGQSPHPCTHVEPECGYENKTDTRSGMTPVPHSARVDLE
eukprot:2991861-Amphidinium_carterae.1